MAFNIEDGGLCPLPQSSIIKNAETVETTSGAHTGESIFCPWKYFDSWQYFSPWKYSMEFAVLLALEKCLEAGKKGMVISPRGLLVSQRRLRSLSNLPTLASPRSSKQ